MLKRGYIILIAGGALVIAGVVVSALWASSFVGQFLQDNMIFGQTLVRPSESTNADCSAMNKRQNHILWLSFTWVIMSIESIRLSSFMTRNVKTETEDQNIQAVCKTMNDNNIGSLIIMTPPYNNNPKPVGIMTERDVVRIIGQLYPALQHAPIKELMSKPLITLSTNSTIKDAMQAMQQNNIRRIPIVEGEKIQGIVTDKDIFKAIMDNRIPLDNLVSGAAVAEGHKLVFDQCRDYFFSDIMRRG